MLYIVNHVNFILLFSVLPLVGLVIEKSFEKKVICIAIYVSLAFLLPIFSGYDYVIDNGYGIIIYIILTCGYGLFIMNVQRQIPVTLVFTAVICPICLFLAFVGSMAGTITTEREWSFQNYKVAYVRDQGFSGGPLMTYQLSKYAKMPLFIKHIDTKVDTDTTGSCWVKFADTRFNFNKCNRELSFFEKK
jgi:uncharacterized membrane protein YfhO